MLTTWLEMQVKQRLCSLDFCNSALFHYFFCDIFSCSCPALMAKQMKWTFSWCFAQKCHGPAQVHSSWILFQSKLEETHWIKLCKSALLSISDLKQGFPLRMAQSYGGAVAHSIAVGSRAHHSKVSKSVEDFATLGSGQTDLDRGSSFTASFQSLKEYSFEQINRTLLCTFFSGSSNTIEDTAAICQFAEFWMWMLNRLNRRTW